ncbi:ArnT family glycosyltransferase [Roseibium limicola]
MTGADTPADLDAGASRSSDSAAETQKVPMGHSSAEQAANADAKNGFSGSSESTTLKPWWMRLFAHDFSAPLLLLLLSLLIFAPGQWTVPPLDRDEPRFSQASKQMLESGDYIDIRFQDQARHKKPVGIYWAQVAAAKLTGHDATAPIWVYRLPSLIAALLVVQLTYWFARAFASPSVALVAGLFVAVAIIVGVEARLAKTDAALFAAIVLAQGALARLWLKPDNRSYFGLAFLFWTALGLGVLVKGPVAPMVVGLTVLALMLLDRKAAWFKRAMPLFGVLWLAVIVLPWFIAITVATDGSFFQEAIGKDLLGKVGQGQEGHGAPPFTHLAVMFAVFWPLPAFALLSAGTIWREKSSPLVRYCVAWFIPSWVVFELVATKLPHYTIPLLPALVVPVAAALIDGAGSRAGSLAGRGLKWVAMVLLALPALALLAASLGGPAYLGDWPSPPGVVIIGLAAVLAVMAARKLRLDTPLAAIPAAVGSSLLVAIGFWGFVGPALQTIWVSPRLVTAISEASSCASPQVASSGFNEPSFIFLQGTDTQLIGPKENADFLAATRPDGEAGTARACRLSAVESQFEERFLQEAGKNGLVPVLLDRVQGLNINGGDRLDIGLYGLPEPVSGDPEALPVEDTPTMN